VSSRGRNGDRDDWLISDLRQRARTARVGGALLADDVPSRSGREPADVLGRLENMEGTLAHLRGRVGRVEGEVARIAVSRNGDGQISGHVLFFPANDGYRLVEADGPPPAYGDELDHEDARYRVLRFVRSPFPRDQRTCAILERVDPAG
jgi:hypothetical protein